MFAAGTSRQIWDETSTSYQALKDLYLCKKCLVLFIGQHVSVLGKERTILFFFFGCMVARVILCPGNIKLTPLLICPWHGS